MKKLFLVVLTGLFLVACSGISKKSSPLEVVGKTYELEGTIAESSVDITFEEDQLSGSAGVNRYFAPYLIKGDSLSVSVVGTTRRMGPEDLMAQEMEFVKMLQNAKSIKVEGEQLTITTKDGKEMTFIEKIMTFEEVVAGKTYTLVGSLEENQITIKFAEGRLAGSAGINGYSTSYEVDGEEIRISPQIISTMMAGPEEAMNQESAYLMDLSKAEKVEMDGNRLLITLEGGKVLIFE